MRNLVVAKYIRGEGIEIGALHNPTQLPANSKVKYVDQCSREELQAMYKDLKSRRLVKVDLVDNGETLGKLAPDSQDFIIANHFLEHCQDPFRVIKRMFELLRYDAILFITLPDKRFTFDSHRKTTTIEHLLKDYLEGPDVSYAQHIREYASNEPTINENLLQEILSGKQKIDYHFHAWTSDLVLEFLVKLKTVLNIEFETEAFIRNGDFEDIFVLRKKA